MSLSIMQQALVNAGLLESERAERVNTIEKDKKRKQQRAMKRAAEKQEMTKRVMSDNRQPKPNQNRKFPAAKSL